MFSMVSVKGLLLKHVQNLAQAAILYNVITIFAIFDA